MIFQEKLPPSKESYKSDSSRQKIIAQNRENAKTQKNATVAENKRTWFMTQSCCHIENSEVFEKIIIV